MISLVQIEYILALYEERNFQRAADKCFVTQPTLSVQLKKAEKQLGGRLFNRDVTPLEPTLFLTKLLPVFHQLKSDMLKLEQRVKHYSTGQKEEIVIGVIPTIAHYLIPDLFGVLTEKFSSFSLRFEEHRTEELLHLLEKRKLDIIILSGPIETKGFELQKLFIEEILFYMDKPRKVTSVKELENDKPWLMNEGNCLRAQMVNFCELNDVTATNWQYQGSSIDVLIRMVERYGGFTVVPANYPKDTFDKSKLISMSNPTPARSIVAGYNRRNVNYEVFVKLFQTIQSIYTESQSKDWEFLEWN
jgi:LysR family transcriptional regulator, hydrogen peroxide-inducible genes activator